MSVTYVRYETATGRITGRGSSVTEAIALTKLRPSNSLIIEYLESEELRTNYILLGAITPRVALSASWDKQTIDADGVDEATLSGLPIPCTVTVDKDDIIVTDGSFEFSASSVGNYRVIVDEVAYLRQEWTIDVN